MTVSGVSGDSNKVFPALLAAILMHPISATAQSSITVYEYDALGRLIATQAPNAKVIYSLDVAGNRAAVQSQRQFDTSWNAASLPHTTGYSEYSGWGADIYQPQGYMIYGPYVDTVQAGRRIATYNLLVDDNKFANQAAVAILDVNDATTGEVIATRSLTWMSFAGSWSYQTFEVPFTITQNRASHLIEFRVYYTSRGHINVDRVGYY